MRIVGDDELYVQYHDQEWGYPEGNDMKLFEKFVSKDFRPVWLG